MIITRWHLFQSSLTTCLLCLVYIFYTFYLIRKKKICLCRKMIWGLACFWLLLDCCMDLLFSATNILVNNPFPFLTVQSLFFPISGIIIGGFIYITYFQWNLMCVYKINGKPIPIEKRSILQKWSFIVMLITLALHFLLYSLFIISNT